jgi:hypothetical protein
MKIRFPSDRRSTWRAHFLAIAREAESTAQRAPSRSATWARRPRLTGFVPGRIRAESMTL